MASIREDKSVTPRAWFIHYRDPDGTQRTRKIVGAATKRQADAYRIQVEARVARGEFGDPRDSPKPPSNDLVTVSIEGWSRTLKNRRAVSDGQQARKWLVPSAALTAPMDQFALKTVKAFLREMGGTDLGGGSQRRVLGLLSRWASWAVGEELIASNPCRDLPLTHRPVYDRGDPTTKPWIHTDEELSSIMGLLPYPINIALWLGNRSGLRLGETFGLRISDLADVNKGYIRVAKSFGGPLKESKPGLTKVKHPPIQSDVAAALLKLAVERRDAGAGMDDLLFVPPSLSQFRKGAWPGYKADQVNKIFWRKVRRAIGWPGTWKDATRHSFASRNIIAGVSVHAVSHALGHSSVAVTEKNYAHIIRVVYPHGLLAPMDPAASQRLLTAGEVGGTEAQAAADPNDRDRPAIG